MKWNGNANENEEDEKIERNCITLDENQRPSAPEDACERK
jgi:hypothetical protein